MTRLFNCTRSVFMFMAFVAVCVPAAAGPISVGNVFLWQDPTLGIDSVQVWNFTGDPSLGGYAIPPDYPVLTPLRFDNASVTYVTEDANGDQTSYQVSLGSIFPGTIDTPPSLTFAPGVTLESISFSAVIYPATFTTGSQNYLASDPTASSFLFNTDGTPLQPYQNADIIVNGNPIAGGSSATPEPASWLLLGTALIFGGGVWKRRIAHERRPA